MDIRSGRNRGQRFIKSKPAEAVSNRIIYIAKKDISLAVFIYMVYIYKNIVRFTVFIGNSSLTVAVLCNNTYVTKNKK